MKKYISVGDLLLNMEEIASIVNDRGPGSEITLRSGQKIIATDVAAAAIKKVLKDEDLVAER